MKKHLFTGWPKESVRTFVRTAALGIGLLTPALGWAQPQVGFGNPLDGATFIAGDNISLGAVVTNNGAVITGLDFLANGGVIATGQPDPHGGWDYADGSFLGILNPGGGDEMIDYNTPGMTEFYGLSGNYVTPTVFVGEFTTWVGGNPVTGAATVTLNLTADGKLNATLEGAAPLGTRTLSAGTRSGEETPFTFNWPTVAAGSYTLKAVAKYGASQSVTSAPVQITVVGGKPNCSTLVKNLTRTATHDQSWNDEDNQIAFAWSGVHVAWRAYATGTNNVTTNHIYYARSEDNGATFGPWKLLEERTESGYALSGQWMAVDGYDVHIITLSESYADDQGTHGRRLQYHRSTDGGATFDPPVLLGAQGLEQGYGPALISASYGQVTVAVYSFKQGDPGRINMMHSADGGAHFATTALSPQDYALSQMIQQGGQIALIWQNVYISGTWSDGAAQVACSTDGGTNFTVTSLEDVPSGTALHADQPRIAMYDTNIVAVFIYQNTNATPERAELILRRSSNSGLTFGPPVNLAPDLNDPAVEVPADAQYDVAINGTNVSVVFGTTGNRLYVVYSSDSGATFGPPVVLADAFFNTGNPMELKPRLAQHSHAPNDLHLLWSGSWYAHSEDGGATWTPPVNVMPQHSAWLYSPTPQVAADTMGALHWTLSGVWQSSAYHDADVLYRNFRHAAAPAGSLNFGVQFGQAHESVGRYDNLQLPASQALQLTSAFSVECWVRATGSTNNLEAALVVRTIPYVVNYDAFRLGIAGDGFGNHSFAATLSDGGLENPTAQNPYLLIYPNAWYHVACTYDATAGADNLKLYVNGELQGTATATVELPTTSWPWMVSRFLDGTMDDLRFWNRALTAEEVRDRFTGPLAGNESGLVAYYTFNGTWADSTGNCLPAVPMYQETFAAGADVQPYLQVEMTGSEVKLSWVTFGSNYGPQFTSDLGGGNWQPVSGTPSLVNGRWTLTVPKSSGPAFFRLVR